jgi:hypothetical protein
MAMVTTAAAEWLSKARRLIEETALIFFLRCTDRRFREHLFFLEDGRHSPLTTSPYAPL